MSSINCYCCSGKLFTGCCEPYIKGVKKAPTVETLMRSRYSAYAVHDANYLWATTAPMERKYHSRAAILNWAKSNHWIRLEIISSRETVVEFKAYYLDSRLKAQVHHEKSNFIKLNGSWFYVDGEY